MDPGLGWYERCSTWSKTGDGSVCESWGGCEDGSIRQNHLARTLRRMCRTWPGREAGCGV